MHPSCLFCTPEPPNPVKYNGFEALLLYEILKSVKNHWFLQCFRLSGAPRWSQDGLQEEAKMGSKMSSKMGSKMGHFRVPESRVSPRRNPTSPEQDWATQRPAPQSEFECIGWAPIPFSQVLINLRISVCSHVTAFGYRFL